MHYYQSTYVCTYMYTRAEKNIRNIQYPFEIHYPDTGFELFRIAADCFKQL